jgi:hypothetical protein
LKKRHSDDYITVNKIENEIKKIKELGDEEDPTHNINEL